MKKLMKWKKPLIGAFVVISLLSSLVMVYTIYMQGKIQDKRSNMLAPYELANHVVTTEVKSLFEIDSEVSWDNAVRNSNMDRATRESVYGTYYEDFRFPGFTSVQLLTSLHTVDNASNMQYLIKVDVGDEVYKLLVSYNGSWITDLKIY